MNKLNKVVRSYMSVSPMMMLIKDIFSDIHTELAGVDIRTRMVYDGHNLWIF